MSSPASAAAAGATPQYELRSDLAQYSLPAAQRDETRKLAWANSVCILFLGVAVLNLQQPIFVVRTPDPPPDPLAALIPPPPETELPPPPEEAAIEEVQQEAQDDFDIPDIPVPVVVAAPETVSFAIPVEGYVVVATNARFVPPPPAFVPKAPPPDNSLEFRPIRFGDKTFRKQPPPSYPAELERTRWEGRVEFLITVATNGEPVKVDIKRSSGVSAADRQLIEHIKRNWRRDPGDIGRYSIALDFQLPR